jgi:hypothetical protein
LKFRQQKSLKVSHLVGELGPRIGDGEGVLANGDNGMTQTDFLRLDDGDLPDPIECSLCFKPCRLDGRWW